MIHILQEIESVLDQLIHNQLLMHTIAKEPEYAIEYDALTKTQESLTARASFLQEMFMANKQHYAKLSDLMQRKEIQRQYRNYQRLSSHSIPGFFQMLPQEFTLRPSRKSPKKIHI